jgi:hypothetical protein
VSESYEHVYWQTGCCRIHSPAFLLPRERTIFRIRFHTTQPERIGGCRHPTCWENPGIISSTVDPRSGKPKYPGIPDVQLAYVEAALNRTKTDDFAGAVILAVHHPPYTFGKHVTSMVMLKEIDTICEKVGVWPHAVLSGHAHNYQRFTRSVDGRQIPYVVCGNGRTSAAPEDQRRYVPAHAHRNARFRAAGTQRHGDAR